jgi:microcystin-dependent protein
VLPIADNTALFSLLGNIYGGDGRTTFALPDLRGRFPTSQGSGPGLSIRQIGQRQGSDQSLLTVNQLASHTHLVGAVNQVGDKGGPVTDFISKASNGSSNYHDGPEDVSMDPTMISTTGVTTPSINTSNPYLVVNWCIVLFGIYPSRN